MSYKLKSKVLKTNTSLTSLNIRGNKVEAEGAQHISEVLKVNNSVTSLNLDKNNITIEGAKYLTEALILNFNLKKLSKNNDNLIQLIDDIIKGNDNVTERIAYIIEGCIAINNGNRIEEFKELALCLTDYHLPKELINTMYYSHYITYKKSKLIEDDFVPIFGADHGLTEDWFNRCKVTKGDRWEL